METPPDPQVDLTPREVIKQIRDSYSVRLNATDDDPILEGFRGMASLLTDELYESNTHFFSELLQNADDNDYPPGVTPTLIVRTYDDRIEVLNNEIGFRSEHVRAICHMAKSTKQDRKESATGEKGIGFKAVFQVTNAPEIHSGGFHFRFDKKADPVFGMVVPEWIDTPETTTSGTRIVLPLNKGYRLPHDFLKSLQPELLLFLRRIRHLEFHDFDYGHSIVLARIDDGPVASVTRSIKDDVEESRSSDSRFDFFLHRRRIAMDHIDERRRRQITATDVAIALPLNSTGEVDAILRRRKLFAFLPVKQTELPFFCHGDFVLNTSREAIQEDLPWNQAVRNALGDCLAECIAACRDAAAGATGLRVLVDPSTISDDFLRPVMSTAIESVKHTKCFPAVGEQWVQPDSAIAADTPGIWKLIDPSEFSTLLGKQLVDPDVKGLGGPLRLLGVRTLGLAQLLQCVDNAAWRAARSPAQWSILYATLGRTKLNDASMSLLQAAPIFPLHAGRFAKRAETMVFRRLSAKGAYGFEADLEVLEPEILRACLKSDSEHVDEFLQTLKVTDATPVRVIDDHILPAHTGDAWKAMSDATLRAHLLYVRDHLDQYVAAKGKAADCTLTALSQSLRVKASGSENDEDLYKRSRDLYLGSAYNDPHDLQSLLGDAISASCVSVDYLDAESGVDPDKAQHAWGEFFGQIGAMKIPRVLQNAAGTDFLWPDNVLGGLAEGGSARQWDLLRLIGSHWSHYKQWAFRRNHDHRSPSSLLTALRGCVVRAGLRDVSLESCYEENEANRAVFGDSVPLVKTGFEPDFADALGVVRDPTVRHALDRLASLKASECMDKSVIEPLYKFLDSRFDQHSEEIVSRLKEDDLAFAAHGKSYAWLAPSQVRWLVPRHLRGFAKAGSLSSVWRDLQGFFVDRVGVDEDLVPDDLVDILESLSKSKEEFATLQKATTSIYRELSNDLNTQPDDTDPKWVDRLRNGLLLYTTKGEWWRNEDNVFVGNDAVLTDLLGSESDIAILAVPAENVTKIRPLLDALEIRLLTDAINTELPTDIKAVPWPGFVARWSERFRYIVRFLHNKYPGLCEDALDDGTLVALRDMDGQVCSPLKLTVMLREWSVQHGCDARIVRDGGNLTIYVDEGSVDDWLRVGIELGSVVGLADNESMSLAQLLDGDLQSAERVLMTLNVPDLPSEILEPLFGEVADDWLHQGDTKLDEDVDQSITSHGSDLDENVQFPANGTESASDDEALGFDNGSDDGVGVSDQPSGDGDTNSTDVPERQVAQGPTASTTTQERLGSAESDECERPRARDVDHDGKGRQQAKDVNVDSDPDNNGAASGDMPTTDDQGDDAARFGSHKSQVGTGSEDAATVAEDLSRGADGGESGAAGRGRRKPESDNERDPKRVQSGVRIGNSSVGPPVNPKQAGSRQKRERVTGGDNRERLRSYVAPEPSDGETTDQDERRESIQAIESAAIQFVLAEEERSDRIAHDANKEVAHNKGFDVVSRSLDGANERFIEVKGVAGAWGQRGVMVTPAQFNFSITHGDKTWLYIVEHALTHPQLHRVQNFAQRVWRFGFDEGWAEVAEASAPETAGNSESIGRPVLGQHVILTDGRFGIVEEVKGAGKLRGVVVRLESGESVQRRWVAGEVHPQGQSEH